MAEEFVSLQLASVQTSGTAQAESSTNCPSGRHTKPQGLLHVKLAFVLAGCYGELELLRQSSFSAPHSSSAALNDTHSSLGKKKTKKISASPLLGVKRTDPAALNFASRPSTCLSRPHHCGPDSPALVSCNQVLGPSDGDRGNGQYCQE